MSIDHHNWERWKTRLLQVPLDQVHEKEEILERQGSQPI